MKNTLITILILLLLGLIVWDIFFRQRPIPPQPINYDYSLEVIITHEPFRLAKPFPIQTEPRVVRIYVSDTLALDSLKLLLSEKEILITGLKDIIAINQNYLKQYPSNPKLLSLDLFRDTLSLGMLQISGQIQKASWPIDLNRFNYRWDFENGLTRSITKPPPTDERLKLEYFVGGGVDILRASPFIHGRAETDLWKFRLFGTTKVGLLKKESSSVELGVELKINGKNRN